MTVWLPSLFRSRSSSKSLSTRLKRFALSTCGITGATLATMQSTSGPALAQSSNKPNRPNILFLILDDVGIDQMSIFGYGGTNPPKTPNIDAIANKGVRFRNTWGQPECSPARSAFFTGRYPLRTKVMQAIGPNDLANSQVSPDELTVPKLLKRRGYINGLFGKFHLGGPENNPFGNGSPAALGFDYFYGYVGGLPDSIDTTAGGVGTPGQYTCGFVDDATTGACYLASGDCSDTLSGDTPGRTCMEQGGIYVPNATCSTTMPDLNFDIGNAYYSSPIVINNRFGRVTKLSYSDPRARVYRSQLEVDAATSWIKSRSRKQPWMATVSFSADHTPIQQPPQNSLGSKSGTAASSLDCSNVTDQRTISDMMIEAMDKEIGRLLVQTGLASYDSAGNLVYDPSDHNTMIVISGDNGSFGDMVKAPFDASRAKGTSYQTGVWIPLVVSGPLVAKPNRNVEHMVNVVDLYQLFGEFAGIDNVKRLVPRPVDAKPMLAYLTNPKQKSIRKNNFAIFGQNLSVNPYGNGPCILSGNSCSQTPVSKSVCEDNGGVWWGPGADDPTTAGIPADGLLNCCQVNQFKVANNQTTVFVLPGTSAIRNDRYKIVRSTSLDWDVDSQSCQTIATEEFFEINQAPKKPKLDKDGTQLPIDALTDEQQRNYDVLQQELDDILASSPTCAGDGNFDGVVDAKDIHGWRTTVQQNLKNLDDDSTHSSSWYDFDYNGQTDTYDLKTIQQNLGTKCPKKSQGNG